MELIIDNFQDWITGPWHWAFSGFMIATVMFILILLNKKLGMSSNLNNICSMAGAGKKVPHFNFDWKAQRWNLTVMVGTAVGGLVAAWALVSPEPVQISADTIAHLNGMGVTTPQTTAEGSGYLPTELINFDQLFSLRGFILMVVGGFLVGFGARYAGGCTSGHAISGLSNLQLPSLIAVIGFFIGGLLMAHLLLPLILQLG